MHGLKLKILKMAAEKKFLFYGQKIGFDVLRRCSENGLENCSLVYVVMLYSKCHRVLHIEVVFLKYHRVLHIEVVFIIVNCSQIIGKTVKIETQIEFCSKYDRVLHNEVIFEETSRLQFIRWFPNQNDRYEKRKAIRDIPLSSWQK